MKDKVVILVQGDLYGPPKTQGGQGDLTRTRKLVQTTQNPEIERMLKVQIPGNSTIRKKHRTLLAQGNLCRQELKNGIS